MDTSTRGLREDIVSVLLKLKSLHLPDFDEDFARLCLMGDVAGLLDARAELGEALIRYLEAVDDGTEGG